MKLMSEFSLSSKILLTEQLSRIFGDGGCCRQQNTLIYTIRDCTVTQTMNNTGATWSTKESSRFNLRNQFYNHLKKKKKRGLKKPPTHLSLWCHYSDLLVSPPAWSGYVRRSGRGSDSAPAERLHPVHGLNGP